MPSPRSVAGLADALTDHLAHRGISIDLGLAVTIIRDRRDFIAARFGMTPQGALYQMQTMIPALGDQVAKWLTGSPAQSEAEQAVSA